MVTKKDNALYFHLPPVAESSGLALKPIDVLPESAVVLNSGEELCCEMEYIPFYYHGTADNTPYLHIMGIPVNRLSGEVIVIKATFKDLDELLEKSDLISLHCPLFPETYHMINKDSIAKMKENCIFANYPCTHFLGGAVLVSTLADYSKFAKYIIRS